MNPGRTRNRIAAGGLATALLFAAGTLLARSQQAPAKAPRPMRGESQEMLMGWNEIGNKLITMAKDFPEDKYDFRVQKDQRTFAENILHVAGTDYVMMSAFAGAPKGPEGGENPPRKTFKTKDDVVKLISQAIADGAALIKQQGDEGMNAPVKYPYGNFMVHSSYVWSSCIEHSGEHYGQLVVYYRANGMVPPESRPRTGN